MPDLTFSQIIQTIRDDVVPGHTPLWRSNKGKIGNLYDDCIDDIEHNFDKLLKNYESEK